MKVIKKRVVTSVVIIFLIILSSLKVVDDYADTYTTDAITSAAITYATARAINALVSMVQTSSIEAGIGFVSGSVSVGELLDPLNDLIERFSGIMTLVLASLAAQKVLLLIGSHSVFQILIIGFGLVSILLIQIKKSAEFSIIIRTFLVLVFIRFSLGLAVSLNSGVDYLFLEEETKNNDNQILAFQQNLSSISGSEEVTAEKISQYRVNKELLANKQKVHVRKVSEYREERRPIAAGLHEAEKKLKKAKDATNLLDFFNEEIDAAGQKVDDLEDRLDRKDKRIKDKEERIDEIQEEMDELERKINGESGGLIGKVKQSSIGFWEKLDLEELEKKISAGIRSFMNLIAIYFLKTIIFPLLFFYLFYIAIKKLWSIQM